MQNKEIVAGTAEKGDVLLIFFPKKHGKEIILKDIPHPRFHDAICAVVEKEMTRAGVDDVQVVVEDRGALDFVLRARLCTVIRRWEAQEQ